MTNVPIEDVNATIDQVKRLNESGADLVRLAVRNEDSIEYLKKIRQEVKTPISADVHFNYRIAIKAIEAGIDKIRINPGNIGNRDRVQEVVKAAKDFLVPIRIGVNSGSVDRKKYSKITPENLVESAIEHIRILEDNDFFDIVVSIKSSDLFQTIEANKLFSSMRDYPLHIGLTEAGYDTACIVQSSVAIGHLLLEGLGDTIRVSKTGDPVDEVVIAKSILESVGERMPLLKIISCPTCGRTYPSIDILELAKSIEAEICSSFDKTLETMNLSITIAVMGCEVNGPGEASHADIGVAGMKGGDMLLFSQGKRLKKIKIQDAIRMIKEEIEKIIDRNLSS